MSNVAQSLNKTLRTGDSVAEDTMPEDFRVELDPEGHPVYLKMAHHRALTDKGEMPSSLGLGYAQFCPCLTQLCDIDNTVTDSDLAHLEELKKLNLLRIASDKVTDEGIMHLKSVSSLKQAELYCPKVTEVGIKALRDCLPECEIQYGPGPFE